MCSSDLTGIVHQHIKATESFDDRLDRHLRLDFIGNIEREERHKLPIFLLQISQVCDFASSGGDLITIRKRGFCKGAAQPA